MAGIIGTLDAFDSSEESWETYVERVEQYFVANKVDDDRKVACLISVMGSETYGLLKTLCAPAKPSAKDFADIVKRLSEHLDPKPSALGERFRFNNRIQGEGEDITTYMTSLRRLSIHCEYGDNLDNMLRDKFVFGLRSERTQTKLLKEKLADLTINKALEAAKLDEIARRDVSEIQACAKASTVTHTESAVHMLHTQTKDLKPCYHCGRSNHQPDRCRFRNAVCHRCSKVGHIQPVCHTHMADNASETRSKPSGRTFTQRSRSTRVNQVTEYNSDDSDDHDFVIASINSDNKRSTDIIWVNMEVEGRTLKMELDTGAAYSVIPYTEYEHFFGDLTMQKTHVKLKTYTGEKISPEGILNVDVRYKCQTVKSLRLYVVKTGEQVLFGRDWLHHIKLDWPEINSVQEVKTEISTGNTDMDALIAKYSTVFADGLGKLRDFKAKLTVPENS